MDRSAVVLVLTLPTAGVILAAWLAIRGQWMDPANFWVFVVLWGTTLFGIEAGYHRYFSHHAFDTGPVFESVLAMLGSMAFQGPVVWWAAMHRRHHKHSDRPGDPHSPHLRGPGVRGAARGLWDAHMAWLFSEVDSISRKSSWAPLVPDLLSNRHVWAIHRRYLWWLVLGLLLPGVLGGLLNWSLEGALIGLLWGGLVRIFLVNHAIWAVNSICHVYGKRPFALHAKDRSANNGWIAMLSLGAGWHHNHHMFPAAATTSVERWQIDGSGLVLQMLARLGIVWNLRTAPQTAGVPAWSRHVGVRVSMGDISGSGVLSNLRVRGAFLETEVPCSIGSSIQLRDFEVREGRSSSHSVEVSAVDAIVERVGFAGLHIRFDRPSPEVETVLSRLRRRVTAPP